MAKPSGRTRRNLATPTYRSVLGNPTPLALVDGIPKTIIVHGKRYTYWRSDNSPLVSFYTRGEALKIVRKLRRQGYKVATAYAGKSNRILGDTGLLVYVRKPS